MQSVTIVPVLQRMRGIDMQNQEQEVEIFNICLDFMEELPAQLNAQIAGAIVLALAGHKDYPPPEGHGPGRLLLGFITASIKGLEIEPPKLH